MIKVKKHTRKRKNGVSVVRQHMKKKTKKSNSPPIGMVYKLSKKSGYGGGQLNKIGKDGMGHFEEHNGVFHTGKKFKAHIKHIKGIADI